MEYCRNVLGVVGEQEGEGLCGSHKDMDATVEKLLELMDGLKRYVVCIWGFL